jgi:hypothetical protein
MLLAALPFSLCVPPAERHEHQTAVVEIMGQVVNKICTTSHETLDATIIGVSGLMEVRVRLERQVVDDVAAWSKAQAAMTARHAGKVAALTAREAASRKLVEATRRKQEGDDAELWIMTDMKALKETLCALHCSP